jgi:hypothetical protein
MFQLIILTIFLMIIYFWGTVPLSSTVLEEFDTQLVGTPLKKADSLIFPAGFLALDRRRQPLANSSEKFGYLWNPCEELQGFHYPPFTPGKIHPITFAEDTTQIVGPIHKAPCPVVGTGPRGRPDLSDLEKVWTGHEMGVRPDLIAKEIESICQCHNSG